MILYHAITIYQLLCCIVHRLVYHRNDFSVMVLPDAIVKKLPNHQHLEEIGLFNKVLLFPYSGIKHDLSMIEDQVRVAYESSIPYPIEEFDSIIIGGAHNYFTIYVILKGVHFSIFEEASGMLGRAEKLKGIAEGVNKSHFGITMRYGLYDFAHEALIEKYCDFSVQPKDFHDPKAKDFRLGNLLESLLTEDKTRIMRFFLCPEKVDVEENAILILTQHFVHVRLLSFENQILIYQLLVDYFAGGCPLVIKPHPDDIMYYEALFPGAKVIKEKFPSELLPYIFTQRPRTAMTVSSASLYNLSSHFNDTMVFSELYEKTFFAIHRYFAVLCYLQRLRRDCIRCYCYGVNRKLLENLVKHSMSHISEYKFITDVPIADIPPGSIVLFDDFDTLMNTGYELMGEFGEDYSAKISEKTIVSYLRNIDRNGIAIFLNSQQHYRFYEPDEDWVTDHMTPIMISEAAREGEYFNAPSQEEIIYVYTKNTTDRKNAEDLEFQKILENSGLTIDTKPLTQEGRRIKILEGILEATNRRLLHCIKNNKNIKNTDS